MTTLLDEDQNAKAKLLLLVEVGCSQRTRQFPVVLPLSVQHEGPFTMNTEIYQNESVQ